MSSPVWRWSRRRWRTTRRPHRPGHPGFCDGAAHTATGRPDPHSPSLPPLPKLITLAQTASAAEVHVYGIDATTVLWPRVWACPASERAFRSGKQPREVQLMMLTDNSAGTAQVAAVRRAAEQVNGTFRLPVLSVRDMWMSCLWRLC